MDHVVLYIHDFRSSGVVRNALALARRLSQEHRTTLVAGYDLGHFRDEAISGPFDTLALVPAPGPVSRAVATMRLRRWLATQSPCLLLSVGNMGHVTAYWATRGLPHVRRVYRISNVIARDDGAWTLLRRFWMSMLVRDAARIILVGGANSGLPPFAEAIRRGRAVAIPNGIDREEALRMAAEPAPHPWLEDDIPTVLAIGRLRPQKNFGLLIEAVGRARRTRRLRLIIIGGGADRERQRLAGIANAAGLGGDMLLAGETNNVFAWLGRAGVFALPSLWEGSSMALLEAMAVGAPVIASYQAGDAAQVLGDGRYGLLLDGRDVDALAEALLIQTSPDAVRPGDRVAVYGLSVDCYALVIREAMGEIRAEPVRDEP